MVFLAGVVLGFSIIIAIGPQNIFIIKQGMKREYAYRCALICFLCDSAMVLISILGMHRFLLQFQTAKMVLMVVAVIFLVAYASFCFKNAYKNRLNKDGYVKNLDPGTEQESSEKFLKLVLLSLGFSILNPQAILDCMLIVGGYAQGYAGNAQYLFGFGVLLASLIWFLGLTTISIWAGEHLKKAIVWYYLEMASGILMLLAAGRCLLQIFCPSPL